MFKKKRKKIQIPLIINALNFVGMRSLVFFYIYFEIYFLQKKCTLLYLIAIHICMQLSISNVGYTHLYDSSFLLHNNIFNCVYATCNILFSKISFVSSKVISSEIRPLSRVISHSPNYKKSASLSISALSGRQGRHTHAKYIWGGGWYNAASGLI